MVTCSSGNKKLESSNTASNLKKTLDTHHKTLYGLVINNQVLRKTKIAVKILSRKGHIL